MKRVMTLALILLMFVCLVSCAKKEATVSDGGPITFRFYSQDGTEDMPWDDPIALEITKRTGVTLEFEHPVGGDTQTIPLMMASGDYPDLIYAKGDTTKLIDAGAILKLDDYIEKYGQNLKGLYGDQIVRLKNTPEDPSIYTVGAYDVKKAILETSGTMQIQHAVLKELGYPQIKTVTDYENAIRAYMQKYPEIDGQKTIGLSLLIDTWQWYIDLSNPGNYTIGYPDDGQWIVDDKLQARYKFLDPEISQWYKWANKMNAEGLLDPESFTQKEDVWKSKIASGRVLGIAYPNWGYGEARTALIGSGKADRTYAYMPVTMGPQYKDPSLKDYGFSGGWGIAITTKCKDPVRAFKFLDWYCSDETQILVNWGLKDVNYKVENGKRVVPAEEQNRADTDPDYSKKTGVGRWVYPFPQKGSGSVDVNGDWITRTSRQRLIDIYLPVEKETLAAYGVEMWIDLFPSSEELGVSKHGQVWQYALPPETNEKVTAADEYVKTALSQCVLCEPSEFDAKWAELQNHLIEMGMEQVGKEVTAIIGQKMDLWYGSNK